MQKNCNYLLRYLFLIILSCSSTMMYGGNGKGNDTLSSKFVRFNDVFSDSVKVLGNIKVNGEVRFVTFYRHMDSYYQDMESGAHSLAFVSYPETKQALTSNAAIPLVNLNLSAKPTASTEFDLGYSFNHNFTGDFNGKSKEVGSRSNLNFGGKFKTEVGHFALKAGGGVIWSSMSPLTLSNLEYTNDQFDRLPWDWYTQNWSKYEGFYKNGLSMGGESYGNIAFQGFKLQGQGLPLDFTLDAYYGRTNFSTNQEGVFELRPNMLTAGRLGKLVGNHLIGINYYDQHGLATSTNLDSVDNRRVITADGTFDLNTVKIYTELGLGQLDNPDLVKQSGLAFISKIDINERAFGLPLSVQLYSIDKNVVSNVSASINSNPYAPSGGYVTKPKYNGQLMINMMQEVGQYSNNRNGMALKTRKFIGDLGIEFGVGLSQEKENLYDTITFMHRANTFSRSRFTPWVQDAGPYSRVKNNFRRSHETATITDVSDKKKGFSAFDVVLKYKFDLGSKGKSIIVRDYLSYNTIQDGLMPKFGSNGYLTNMYNQLITFVKVTNKLTLVGIAELEKTQGTNRIQVADENGNTIIDNTTFEAIYSENGKTLQQIGTGFGVGFDWDFSNFAGIYGRHRWMSHKDNSFTRDVYKGTETTIELKVFF